MQGAAAFGHRRDHAGGFVGHDFGAFVRHEAGDGQFDQGDFLAILEDDDPAADFAEAVGGQGHVGLAGAGDDHVVAVVGDGGGDGAGRVEAEAMHEAVGDAAGGLMAFDEGNLADVLLWIALHQAVFDGQDADEGAGGGLIFDDADDAGFYAGGWRWDDWGSGC